MNTPRPLGESDYPRGETPFTPSIWIDVRKWEDSGVPPARRYVAMLKGLQTLKCSGVLGYGSTEEEAVLNLRRKILQFLEFQKTQDG